MLLGVCPSGSFWNSVFQIMLLLAGLQVVDILYIETVFGSMGIPLLLTFVFLLKGTWSLKIYAIFSNMKQSIYFDKL